MAAPRPTNLPCLRHRPDASRRARRREQFDLHRQDGVIEPDLWTTYMAICAGIASLAGHLHGGANEAVMNMMEHMKRGLRDWEDDDEISAYLRGLLDGRHGDRSGKIYGMDRCLHYLRPPRRHPQKRPLPSPRRRGWMNSGSSKKWRDSAPRSSGRERVKSSARTSISSQAFSTTCSTSPRNSSLHHLPCPVSSVGPLTGSKRSSRAGLSALPMCQPWKASDRTFPGIAMKRERGSMLHRPLSYSEAVKVVVPSPLLLLEGSWA
ncbi:MAG: hypothetical protein MZV64_71090 [Ignavibacteriales bacterium]|nr:hypothetical protein [Ignavibacteriales bacterium]